MRLDALWPRKRGEEGWGKTSAASFLGYPKSVLGLTPLSSFLTFYLRSYLGSLRLSCAGHRKTKAMGKTSKPYRVTGKEGIGIRSRHWSCHQLCGSEPSMEGWMMGLTRALALTLALTTTAVAEDQRFFALTGTQAMDFCTSDKGGCHMLMAGYHDMRLLSTRKDDYCLPWKTNLDTMRQVFMNHLRDHPQHHHLPGSKLYMDAMVEAWPCSR